jgi:hypothetical protein
MRLVARLLGIFSLSLRFSCRMSRKIPIYIFLLMVSWSSAQSPGGVSGNLRGWYKGNAGISLSAGFVSQWNDQSGNAFNATQINAGRRATVGTAAINYNNTVVFDGTDDYYNVSDLMASNVQAMTAFAVVRQTNTKRDEYGNIFKGQSNPSNASNGGGYGFYSSVSTNTAFGFYVRDAGSNSVTFADSMANATMLGGNWNGTTANNVEYFFNGASKGTAPFTPGTVGDNGSTYIASGIGNGTEYCFYGDIAELVVYNTGLSSANMNRVASYLAVKWGITKTGSYINSNSSTIFSNAGSYTANIIGIGRDDNSGLVQKQSRTPDDSSRVFISSLAASNTANTGAFSADLSFIVVGSNTAAVRSMTAETPTGLYGRLEREWEVTNTAFTSTFSFAVRLTAAAMPASVTTSDLRLLVDTDGDFSNAAVYTTTDGITFSYSNPVITVSGISTAMIPSNSTRYITIGTVSGNNTPLPIELSAFDAWRCADEVCLAWETSAEFLNSHFDVERAGGDAGFHRISTTPSKAAGGVSSRKTVYESEDREPLPGLNYYRLKQVDSDGSSAYSNIVMVDFAGAPGQRISVYPNPGDGSFAVSAENISDLRLNVKLVNNLGETVVSRELHREEGELEFLFESVEPLPPGMYLCLISTPQKTWSLKLLVR